MYAPGPNRYTFEIAGYKQIRIDSKPVSLNPDEFVLTETVEEMTAEELFKMYPELRAQATGAGGTGPVTNKVRLQPATGESRVEKGATKNKKKHRNFFTSSILKLTDWMI